MNAEPSLREVAREWGRIGSLGFGGPPAHIRMLRDACVGRWVSAEEFEDGVAACNLLPGPASTQLAILCGWHARGRAGAIVGGLAFVLPGLVAIIALTALFLAGSPPLALTGAALGMSAAVPAVALSAGLSLLPSSWSRATSQPRWVAYAALGAVAAAVAGAWVVLVLLACGLAEVGFRRTTVRRSNAASLAPLWLVAAPATVTLTGGLAASIAWVAFKAGALSYGGGFVIVPLMQGDAVERYGWMTPAQFLTAVALGQVTPGPVLHTVSAVGFAAGGVGGALLAATVAFAPSFLMILLGAQHLGRLSASPGPRAFLQGAGPAAIGAILGSAVPLALGLTAGWQWAVLAAAAVALLALRRGVVPVLLVAAAVGAAVAALSG